MSTKYYTPKNITPSDAIPLKGTTYFITIGTGGDIKYDDAGGTARTVTMPAGNALPFAATKVYATGTTASGLVGHF